MGRRSVPDRGETRRAAGERQNPYPAHPVPARTGRPDRSLAAHQVSRPDAPGPVGPGPGAAVHGNEEANGGDRSAVINRPSGPSPAGDDLLSRQRRRLVDWIRRQLIGPASGDRLRGSPVERYPTGVLHPIDPGAVGMTGLDPAQPEKDKDDAAPQLESAEPSVGPRTAAAAIAAALPDDEEDDSPIGADGSPGRAAARAVSRRRYVPPSSVGVSFHVRGDARVRVTVSAAAYRRVHERGERGQFVASSERDPRGSARRARGERNGDELVGDGVAGRGVAAGDQKPGGPAAGGSGARYERTPFECGLVWPEGDVTASDGVDHEVTRRPYRDGDVLSATFARDAATTPSKPGSCVTAQWAVQVDVRRRTHRDGHILTVIFANRREGVPGTDRAEQRLFEARLECAVESGEVAEYPRVDPALLTDEEQEIELRYRDVHIYAVGHGASADWSLEPGCPPRIWSACMPAVDVPPVTTEVDGLDRRVLVMQDIADEARFVESLDRFDTFVDGYDAWVARQWDTAGRFSGGEEAAATRICEQMDKARARMRGGVELLRRDADAARAFRLANRAMLDQMCQQDRVRGRDRDPCDYRWRPFQLAFLLAVVASTIDECDPCRDVLDLIWFPTGGGKTEAYLGLFAFLVVWRRLRYGEAGGGTVVLMRYTLRLLTRQQFERATRIVCALELLRRRGVAPIGEEPVTVGLWVGAAASPNTFQDAAKHVAMASETNGRQVVQDDDPQPAGHAAAADSDTLPPRRQSGGDGGHEHHLVLRSCPWCGQPFTAPDSYDAGGTKFGFMCRNPACEFVDGPLPCNVVDEALYERPPTLLVATIDKFARLAWEERAAVFFGRGDARPPELVIQDELHLIAGPLGSVAGVYEAALETVIERRGVRPKYVASTATIRMAREQVRRLYGRETAVFPPPGLSADDSWFARTDRSRPGRLFVGYLAPGLDQLHCLTPLAAALLAAPLAVFSGQPDADDLLDAWWTLVVYHGSLRGVGASHNAFVTDVRAFLRQLEDQRRETGRARQDLEAFDQRAPGDDEADSGWGEQPSVVPLTGQLTAQDGAEASDQRRGGEADPDVRRDQPSVAQLTSQSTAQENADTFDRLAARRGAAECLDAVLATNMISVGVDVDRLAVMVINGQPLTTAEYIQASSRIGRADVPGLVFANYYRHQARSLSHYENFRPYHASFYRFVEPTSVTPFTYQVRKRALHAALVIALRHGGVWTANSAAGRFASDDRRAQDVIEALKRRCRRAEAGAGEAIDAHVDRLVDEWDDLAARCRCEKRQLQYDCRDKSADRLLCGFDDLRPGGWKTLRSMRNIEDPAVLQTGR